MKERELEKQCHDVLRSALAPMPFLWHINDMTTAGLPDSEVVWHGHTSHLEFKKLKHTESVHDVWEDGRQLITLVQLEKASMGRAWVICYQRRKASQDRTIIYRPTRLLGGKLPTPFTVAAVLTPQASTQAAEKLWNDGAIVMLGGFKAGHDLVAAIIKETHK